MEGNKKISSTPPETGRQAKEQAGVAAPAAASSDGRRAGSGGDGAGAALPAWKLDCLCRESGSGMTAVLSTGFPCF